MDATIQALRLAEAVADSTAPVLKPVISIVIGILEIAEVRDTFMLTAFYTDLSSSPLYRRLGRLASNVAHSHSVPPR